MALIANYFVTFDLLKHKQQQQSGGACSVKDSLVEIAIKLLSPSIQLIQYR